MSVLQTEIEKLTERLEKRKADYSRVSDDHIPVTADLKVKDKFVLENSACWILAVELECPIQSLALQSDVDVELIDVDTNVAIVSKSKQEKDTSSNTKLLAVYRNTEPVNRIEVKFRTIEGSSGYIQAFVIPALTPKTAQMLTYQIRPLSLHQRLTEKPKGLEADAILNSLTIEGKFSMADINSWLGMCLPDIPERPHGEEITFYFRSTFLGTLLSAKFKAGEGVFRSDSVSTLAILKDFVTKHATSRKIQVKCPFEIKEETCGHVLALLHPKLQYQLSLSEKVKLIEALKEIEMQEQEISFMSAEYKEILEKAKQIEKEFDQQPRRLEFLHTIVKSLYMDKFKFKGQNVAHKMPAVQALLDKYDLKTLQAFFLQN